MILAVGAVVGLSCGKAEHAGKNNKVDPKEKSAKERLKSENLDRDDDESDEILQTDVESANDGASSAQEQTTSPINSNPQPVAPVASTPDVAPVATQPPQLPATTTQTPVADPPVATPSTPAPATAPAGNSREVVFTIPAGTGRKAWNTQDNPVIVEQGQVLLIKNDDSTSHLLHSGGQGLCPHGGDTPRFFGNIKPEGDRCTIGANARLGPQGFALHDHNTNAYFYVTVVKPGEGSTQAQ